MTDRASAIQALQLGVEITPGTSVAANKRLGGFGVVLSLPGVGKSFRPDGHKYPSTMVPGKEWTEAAITGVADFRGDVYLLSSAIEKVTPTAGVWTFVGADTAADTIQTYTLEKGDSVRAAKCTYGFVNELTYSWTRDDIAVTGKMLAQQLQDGITMTPTPTDVAPLPVSPADVTIYADTTAAGLGTTKLSRATKCDWKYGPARGMVWAIDASLGSFAAHIDVANTGTVTLSLEADSVGMAFVSSYRAGTPCFLRIEADGPVVGGTHMKEVHDLSLLVRQISKLADNAGVFGIDVDFDIVKDATWGKAFSIAVTNDVTSL